MNSKRESIIGQLTIARRKALEAGRTELANQLEEDIRRMRRAEELDEMREYAIAEALDAGLDEGQADSVRDIAMSAYHETDGVIDRDHFEEMVRDVIQGVAMP